MNLSETKVIARKFIFIAVVMTILYYVVVFTYRFGEKIFKFINPPVIAGPEAKYGKLDRLEMQTITLNNGIEYVLDTKTGGLPQTPDRMKVYKFEEPIPSLLSEQQMKKLALDLGYKQASTKISNSDFKWVDGLNKRQMNANIVTKYFTSITDKDKLSSVLSVIPSIKEADAVAAVKNFLSSQGLVEKTDMDVMEYSTVPTIIQFGNFKDTVLFPSNAKLIKVNANRHLLTKKQQGNELVDDQNYKILGPNPKNSMISFFVSNSQDVFKIPEINFNYQKIKINDKSTSYDGSDYPLSPITSVWDAVRQGSGVVSYAKLKSQDYYKDNPNLNIQKVFIRDVSLAYYEPDKVSTYLQPIYVFEGVFTTNAEAGKQPQEGEIVIYFPAVSGDFVN